jgi:hypothetical protein
MGCAQLEATQRVFSPGGQFTAEDVVAAADLLRRRPDLQAEQEVASEPSQQEATDAKEST